MRNYLLPDFLVQIAPHCEGCGRCVRECSFEALRMEDGKVVADHARCVACQRCVVFCPYGAIAVVSNPCTTRPNANWTPEVRHNILRQAQSGAMLLAGTGNDQPYPILWDHLLLDACQVTNPPIDPLREPMEVITYLGRKPDRLEFSIDSDGLPVLETSLPPQLKLEIPIIFGAMSLGAVNLNVHKILAEAARRAGTLYNCGEGGLHEEMYEYGPQTIVQVASGRFGVHQRYLEAAAAIEIKIGQGAKPGIGGHLPGEKVTEEIARTRMIPPGTDALSPAPHHDIYSIEDLAQLVYALKEATNCGKPVGVKIAAVHHVAAIASGVARAGADFLTIDGFRGGTGAAPLVIRNHVGIPLELALAAVDDRLREEGIRHQISIIASGGIRSSADVAKAIALGADAVAICTAALVALGCSLCQACYTGKCAWGLTTQDERLMRRQRVEEGTERVYNLLRAWTLELKDVLGALGINAIESLRGNRERLRGLGLDQSTLDVLGIRPAGR
ncbi:MAG TPA: FMN-binding glutamate synthase family protein [Anaerolineae bacterium]|nr:FMN-binding glutamate synthase family protein [Anaerolineae bacterium]